MKGLGHCVMAFGGWTPLGRGGEGGVEGEGKKESGGPPNVGSALTPMNA